MEPATTTSTRDADAVGSVCSASGRGWRTLNVIVRGAVGYLELAQPDSRNAFTAEMLQEIPHAVKELEEHPDVRVVVVQGQGPDFCAGINLSSFGGLVQELLQPEGCPGRARFRFQQTIRSMQEALTVFESCRWPVIAAVQGNCIGGGVDLICCCDVRICTDSARFSVKEIDIAIAADLGSLQRLPRLIGHGRAAALALTGHSISAQDAMAMGLVSFCAPDSAALDAAAAQLADALAAKSPLALAATKRALLHSRDHPVPQGLEYVALLNSAVLPSHDVVATLQALRKRSAPPVAYPRL